MASRSGQTPGDDERLVFLPGGAFHSEYGPIALPDAALAIGALPREVLHQSVTLRYPAAVSLSAQYVRNLTATRSSDGCPLRAGVDFSLAENCGSISGMPGSCDCSAQIEYTAWSHRYDAVCFDPNSTRLVYLQGQPRLFDPEEYRPVPPEKLLHLYNLYVWPDGVEIIDVHAWTGFVRRGHEDQHKALQEYCRGALQPALQKAFRTGSLRIGGYGDSNTSIGSRDSAMHTAPNGPARDIMGHFRRYPRDTRLKAAKILDADGTEHVRVGWCWPLVEAFAARGIVAEFRNWGVPGTSVGAAARVGDEGIKVFGGSHPERLKYLLADGCDLVILGFGANDVGTPNLHQRFLELITAIHAGGARCLVVNVPAFNPYTMLRSYQEWLRANAAIRQAAIDAGAAYAPLESLFAVGNEGAIGLSRRSYCAGNLINHPGISELRAIGDYIVRLIF